MKADVVVWPLPTSLVLIPTYRCSAACKDCCFHSNPHISHRVPQERLLGYIEQARNLQTVHLVCISGGEAFLLKDDLVELVAKSSGLGFMTRIVTNGYWATSIRAAHSRLKPLVAAGLNEINFSTGDDHAEFVSLRKVATGVAVALRVGLRVVLVIEETVRRRVSLPAFLEAANEFSDVVEAVKNKRLQVIESPWMKFGESEDVQPRNRPSRLANSKNIDYREPCRSILTTVVVTPREQLGMCCGLSREDIPDLNQGSLLNESMEALFLKGCYDFLKIWLFVEGPERILAWAATKDPSIKWEDLYAHNCDACRAMYHDSRVQAVIRDHYQEKYDEILNLFSLYLAGPRVSNPQLRAGFGRVGSLSPAATYQEGQLVQISCS